MRHAFDLKEKYKGLGVCMNWCHIYIDVHFSSFFWLPHSLAYTLTRLNSLPLYEKDRGTPK